MKLPIVIKWPEPKQRTKRERNERIYTRLATCTAIVSLTWVQILYNEPAAWKSKTWDEWLVVAVIGGVIVYAQRLIAMKAYLSDPNVINAPPDFVPPPAPEPPAGAVTPHSSTGPSAPPAPPAP